MTKSDTTPKGQNALLIRDQLRTAIRRSTLEAITPGALAELPL